MPLITCSPSTAEANEGQELDPQPSQFLLVSVYAVRPPAYFRADPPGGSAEVMSGYTTVREHKPRKRVLVPRFLDDTVREERSAHDRMYGR